MLINISYYAFFIKNNFAIYMIEIYPFKAVTPYLGTLSRNKIKEIIIHRN